MDKIYSILFPGGCLNGGTFTPIEEEQCTKMQLASGLASILSDNEVLMLNCSHCFDEVTSRSQTLF